jgi:hypothetical protein
MPSRSTNGTNGWWRRERAWGLMRWCRWWVTPISRSQTLLRVFSNTNQFFFGKQISPGGIPNSHWKPHQTFISISYCQWNRVIYTTQTGKSQNPMQKHAPASWKKCRMVMQPEFIWESTRNLKSTMRNIFPGPDFWWGISPFLLSW